MIQTGMFSYFKAPIKSAPPIYPKTNITLDQLYDEITNDTYKFITGKLRELTVKSEITAYKEKAFSYITPNGTCSQRNQEFFISPSGYFVADFDDLKIVRKVRERLINDIDLRPVFLIISPGGNGIKALYNIDVSLIDLKVDSNKMHRLFNSLDNYLSIFYSDILMPDTKGNFICGSGTDLLRACFICHDSEAYYNPDESSSINQDFYKEYYRLAEDLQKNESRRENYTGNNIKNIAAKHLPPGSHHPQVHRFASACRHYNIDPFIVENFILNSKNISPESSYHNNPEKAKEEVKDVYKRYPEGKQSAQKTMDTPQPEAMELLRQAAKMDLSNPITEPPALLEIHENGYYRRFASAGDISMITGKGKSKKSFFVSMVIGALLKNELMMGKFMPRINRQRDKIVVFDTEQSRYDAQRYYKRILAVAGLSNSDALEFYSLRKYKAPERLNIVRHTVYNCPGLCFVVIDGVRDLLFDINNSEQAAETVGHLMKWTDELSIHVLTILHENKDNKNPRGHIGTELQNKAETVISIAKGSDPVLSQVTPELTRGREFKPFNFLINADDLPEVVDTGTQPDHGTAMEDKAKKKAPNNYPDATHFGILDTIFGNGDGFTYKELCIQIGLAFSGSGVAIGTNAVVNMATYYQNKKWLYKGQDKPYPKYRRVMGPL